MCPLETPSENTRLNPSCLARIEYTAHLFFFLWPGQDPSWRVGESKGGGAREREGGRRIADLLDGFWSIHHHLLCDFRKPHHMLQAGEGERREQINGKHEETTKQKSKVKHSQLTYNGLVVVLRVGADTDHHSDLALPIKVVLEEMRQLGVAVGDDLEGGREGRRVLIYHWMREGGQESLGRKGKRVWREGYSFING